MGSMIEVAVVLIQELETKLDPLKLPLQFPRVGGTYGGGSKAQPTR
jgi:hypothetical protein